MSECPCTQGWLFTFDFTTSPPPADASVRRDLDALGATMAWIGAELDARRGQTGPEINQLCDRYEAVRDRFHILSDRRLNQLLEDSTHE